MHRWCGQGQTVLHHRQKFHLSSHVKAFNILVGRKSSPPPPPFRLLPELFLKADFQRQREVAKTLDYVIGDNGRLEPRRLGPTAATKKGGTRMGIRTRDRRGAPANHARDGGVTAPPLRQDEQHQERHHHSRQRTPPRSAPPHTTNSRQTSTTPSRREQTTGMRSDPPPRPEPASTPVGDGGLVVAAAASATAEAVRFFYQISSPIRLSAGGGWGVMDSREGRGREGGRACAEMMEERVPGEGRERLGVSKMLFSGQQQQQRQGGGSRDGAGDGDVDSPRGLQEHRVHRADVWKWEYCKGVAVYTVEVEVLGQSHARNVYRR